MKKVELTCSFCSSKFERAKNEANRNRRMDARTFCSRECLRNARTKHLNKCLWCGKSTRNPKYCSSSCSQNAPKAYRKNKNKEYLRECLWCESSFSGRAKRTNKYCSMDCSASHRKELVVQEWLSGERRGYDAGGQTTTVAKRYILDRDNHKCTICSQDEVWNGKPITLQVDHIDGDWKNDRPDNMRTICPNCHTQTKTYGAKNKVRNSPRKRGTRKL